MKKAWILFLIIPLFAPSFLLAQTDASGISEGYIDSMISLSVDPVAPQPGDLVTVRLEATPIDLDQANISWSLDGSRQSSGAGISTFSYKVGELGRSDSVSVTINTGSGIYNKSITVTPSEVDLLWQGYSYVPPFYEGRPLWGKQGLLTITAIPHIVKGGSEMNSSRLIYKWIRDGGVLASGVGKNSLTIQDSALSIPTTVEVDVYTDRDTLVGSAQKTFMPAPVEAQVYENNPLYGLLFNRAISGSFSMNDKEVTFNVFPYFFNRSEVANSLAYFWTTNTGTQNTFSVTYRAPDKPGSSDITAGIRNLASIAESASTKFSIKFGK